MPSFDVHSYWVHTWYIHIHEDKTLIHTQRKFKSLKATKMGANKTQENMTEQVE